MLKFILIYKIEAWNMCFLSLTSKTYGVRIDKRWPAPNVAGTPPSICLIWSIPKMMRITGTIKFSENRFFAPIFLFAFNSVEVEAFFSPTFINVDFCSVVWFFFLLIKQFIDLKFRRIFEELDKLISFTKCSIRMLVIDVVQEMFCWMLCKA